MVSISISGSYFPRKKSFGVTEINLTWKKTTKKRNNSFLLVYNKKARINVFRDHKSTSVRETNPQFKR